MWRQISLPMMTSFWFVVSGEMVHHNFHPLEWSWAGALTCRLISLGGCFFPLVQVQAGRAKTPKL